MSKSSWPRRAARVFFTPVDIPAISISGRSRLSCSERALDSALSSSIIHTFISQILFINQRDTYGESRSVIFYNDILSGNQPDMK